MLSALGYAVVVLASLTFAAIAAAGVYTEARACPTSRRP
jgi:hypothetical protein